MKKIRVSAGGFDRAAVDEGFADLTIRGQRIRCAAEDYARLLEDVRDGKLRLDAAGVTERLDVRGYPNADYVPDDESVRWLIFEPAEDLKIPAGQTHAQTVENVEYTIRLALQDAEALAR